MKKTICLIFLCTIYCPVFCQQYNTVIKGNFKTIKYNSIRLITYNIISEDFNYISQSKIDSQGNFSFQLNLEKPVFCKLFGDFFFITPHDSIEIKAFENSEAVLGYNLSVSESKNSKNYIYYKRFEDKVKSPFINYFKKSNFSWIAFKQLCQEYYTQRLLFLEHSKNNNELSIEFYNFLKKNLLFDYMSSLFQPFSYKISISSIELKDYLKSLGIDSLFRLNSNYEFVTFQQLLNQYFKFIITTELQSLDNGNHFQKQFEYVQENFKGASKEFLISLIFKETVLLPDPKYYEINDLIFNHSKKYFSDSSLISFIEVKYILYKNLHKKIPDDILKTKIKDFDGSEIELGSILSSLKGQNILIDNWASWCGPCITAIKGAKRDINALHEKNIKILYLSQDEDSSQWKKLHSTLRLSKKYSFLLNDPQTTFLKYFNIKSIPHYILIDKNGYLLSQKSSGLTNINQLIKLIEIK